MEGAFTVGDLRQLLEGLPDETAIEIFNDSSEWYGVDRVVPDQFRLIDDRLVLNFGGPWSQYEYLYPDRAGDELARYHKERAKEDAYHAAS